MGWLDTVSPVFCRIPDAKHRRRIARGGAPSEISALIRSTNTPRAVKIGLDRTAEAKMAARREATAEFGFELCPQHCRG